jgi:glycosyltransferase involved in cell wall biosynthesis
MCNSQASAIKVSYAGFRNQSELPGLLAAADIFVLPSALETWGLVINEAMCFSLPVITTDRVGAGGDLVHEGKNGYSYPVGDTARLTQHLSTLVSDAPLRRRMGQESLRIISDWSYREDLDVIAASLERLIPISLVRK